MEKRGVFEQTQLYIIYIIQQMCVYYKTATYLQNHILSNTKA